MNRITLVGRLVRDPETRQTATGKTVASLTIAVDKRIKSKAEGEPTADFFRIACWGNTADYVGNYLTKGRLVSVDGRMESRKYTDQQGNQREVWEVNADGVNGLDRPRDDAQPATAKAGAKADEEWDPFSDEE